MEDQRIIELIRSRKHDKVFTTLYRYYPVVKKLILANGGRSEDAEDIYQEALIVFYKKAAEPDFTLSSGISTYLYSICRYMWMDRLRKNQKYNTDNIRIDENAPADPEIIAAIESENQLMLAEKAIAELGERCRELLLLFYFHSKKLKDIAAKMGYNSENTAKNQKYKCLEAARNKLKALQSND
jgi:RNA polymerase sigma factor (sigma-70 family)